jgi:translation initiation factor IF-1
MAQLAAEPEVDVTGVVAAVLPSAMYRVALSNGHSVLAALDPKARLRLVRLSPGDGVLVRLSPYDLSRGRILGRYPEPGRT